MGEIPGTLAFDYEWRLLWGERAGVKRLGEKFGDSGLVKALITTG